MGSSPLGDCSRLVHNFVWLCVLSASVRPERKNPILAAIVGFVFLLGCLWVLEKCLRLLTGRKHRGGLFSPTALRVVSFFFLIFPVVGLFTGYYQRMGAVAVLQALMYVLSFLGLQKLAQRRAADGDLNKSQDKRTHTESHIGPD
jgi:hypothetical protein